MGLRLQAMQKYICSFQYNHTPEWYFNPKKQRTLDQLIDTADTMMREGLPIKCKDAVFMALNLTQDLPELLRVSVIFNSKMNNRMFGHIVLAVRYEGRWGSLGLSRRKELMYKPLMYKSLPDLIQDYIHAYEQWGHKVIDCRLSLPIFPHSSHICWEFVVIALRARDWECVARTLNSFNANAAKIAVQWTKYGDNVPLWGTACRCPSGSCLGVKAAKSQRRAQSEVKKRPKAEDDPRSAFGGV
eukprot:gnl/Hemi2/4618_TR1599_c0_g1_i1.p1 gnl/Hemi2/4618_TR1599_c0_g1~~gnl/Hemi2/4618_TR1599_c0_g1_i1.p1  ORF type:complete len:243 (+),score=44.92 gnl/Hemi2/4618_TR1599_c0_g1_i1:646-1374(+)